MENQVSTRPPPTPALSGAEFLRWYWLKDELTDFARTLSLKSSGSKELLTRRIAAALDGHTFVEPIRPTSITRRQLSEPLLESTVIPAGQRCSQVLRAWLIARIGPAFHFDAPMREFFAGADGTQTLADAVITWHESRNAGERSIDPQFEYNRFTRSWHQSNPRGTREQLLEGWNEYRSRPADERGRV